MSNETKPATDEQVKSFEEQARRQVFASGGFHRIVEVSTHDALSLIARIRKLEAERDKMKLRIANFEQATASCDEADNRLIDRIRELEQERDSLRAVLDKLPKTADGVVITPGMKVWLPPIESERMIGAEAATVIGEPNLRLQRDGARYITTWSPEFVYSTRALAAHRKAFLK